MKGFIKCFQLVIRYHNMLLMTRGGQLEGCKCVCGPEVVDMDRTSPPPLDAQVKNKHMNNWFLSQNPC